MLVYGLVGESGSGKSYRAQWIAKRLNIPAIIDDGLLIGENRIVAGSSAKKEKTKVGAVKRAIFTDPIQVAEVRIALSKANYPKILILGTSTKMVEKIAEILKIGAVIHIIHIQDIATKEEIEMAKKIRNTEGKHVIPVPTFEVKKDFSGYFIDSITSAFSRKNKKDPDYRGEKTIVRPTFNYLGDYTISDNVLITICRCEALKFQVVKKVPRVTVFSSTDGLSLSVDLSILFGKYSLPKLSKDLTRNIQKIVEQMTSMNVCKIRINFKSIVQAK